MGEWKEDKKSGIGTYYLLNGTKIEVCIKDEIITKGEVIREGKENREIKNIDISKNEKEVIKNI
ncbi:hypothetical protein [Paraclostridium sp. AKS81]|uniref:hypothetical protein n=1 Tax=Paraclostridium sp. AKS81 TaxID=2876117 RepID=UPI0030285715|nr:hypothetical protein [Paraclostridium sp. AKS81]